MDSDNIQKELISFKAYRKHLCTHITSLKLHKNVLFIGEGNWVIIFDISQGLEKGKEIIFKSSTIHGIRINESADKIAFFGAKSLRIYSYSFATTEVLKHNTEEILLADWIHDAQFLSDARAPQLAVVTAHNSLTFWHTDEQNMKSISCSENCILYSGSIIYHDRNVVILAVGTVFQQILLWSPNSSEETNKGKLPFHRLKGHQGVIFSVTFSKVNMLICSTSDDRSLRLWKIQCDLPVMKFSLEFWEKSSISLVSVLYSHESRVWTSSILPSCIISVGEDSTICFWDLNGNLITKKKCHKGGSIWCLETGLNSLITSKSSIIHKPFEYIAFSGGSDGGVNCWEISSKLSEKSITQISFQLQDSSAKLDFPRSLSLLTQNVTNHIMITTDQGCLSFYDLKLKLWVNAHMDDSYASFCVSSVSFQSKYIALGNICGDLTIFDFEGWSCGKHKIKKIKAHHDKICALHWVNKTGMNLLTCGLKGQMVLWKIRQINEDIEINCLKKLYLPKCKQHWWSTVALYTNDLSYLIVGDRGGNLNIYFLQDAANIQGIQEINPCMKHSCIHGDNGVTDLQEKDSLIYSSGKDGKVVVYSLGNHSLNVLNTVKVPHNLEWIGRMMFYKEDLLLLGFYTKYFIVWSSQLESPVLDIECGGGHRSWDFSLEENGKATFVAIKKKDIIHYEENLQFALDKAIVKRGISGQEFTCCCYLFTANKLSSKSMSVFACGGEDTTLRIIGICNESTNTAPLSLCNLSGHLSSIRSIAKVKMLQENAYLLVSVGGRAQMKIWRVTNETSLQCEHLTSYILSTMGKSKKPWKNKSEIHVDPQMRFMDVTVRAYDASYSKDNEKFIIATACSDSLFRVYSFDVQEKCLDLCYSAQYGSHCILRLLSVEIANQPLVHYFVTGATDGELKIIYHEYKNTSSSNNSCTYNHELVFRIQLHKSGINAVDAKNIKENMWLICCGGDDNALSAILLDFNPTLQNGTQVEILSKTLVSAAHASQITGIKFLECGIIASVSIDQRLNIWQWNLNNGKFQISLKNSVMSLIPDVAHMDCWKSSSTSWSAIICGQGIECFNIENLQDK